MTYSSIRPGKLWLDTSGKPIQAHGLTVRYDEARGEYLWLGENKEKTVGGRKNTVWTWGVRLYVSKDFYNWEDRGLIIPPEPNDLASPLHPTYNLDRPHIIYCPATGKHVAWLKVMAGEVSQFMVIMQADALEGPYEMVNPCYQPLDMNAGDFYLHMDSETGKAYIFFERPHFELVCATLTDDFCACSREYSTHYAGRRPPFTREAPVFFERRGKKYLMTSGTSGYYPNQSCVCVFDDYHGEWADLGDPCVGDRSNTTFNSQVSDVLRIPGTELYVACADRWMPQPWVPLMSRQILAGMERHFKDYAPSKDPVGPAKLPGVLQTHTENTSVSRYVFLPIEWEGDVPRLRWHKEWRIEEFV